MLVHCLRRSTNIEPALVSTQQTRPNVGLTLAHRLRRWANIKPTLCRSLVFAGYRSSERTLYSCVKDSRPVSDRVEIYSPVHVHWAVIFQARTVQVGPQESQYSSCYRNLLFMVETSG